MKSYQDRIFDVSENINYSSLATVTFMFLVNDQLVWSDKKVTEHWNYGARDARAFYVFLQFLRI